MQADIWGRGCHFHGDSTSSAKVVCDLEQLPAHLSWMYKMLVVTFFICQEMCYPKCHRSFFFFFFDSCFLFAVAMAKDGEVLPTVFTFL